MKQIAFNIKFNELYREEFPALHPLFPARPTHIRLHILREFIVNSKGEKLYISDEIEDFLASAANFEQSQGSVHQSPLEFLFWVKQKSESIMPQLLNSAGKVNGTGL